MFDNILNYNDKSISVRQLNIHEECPVLGSNLKQSLKLQAAILKELHDKEKDGYVIEKTEDQVKYYMTSHIIYGVFKKKTVRHGEEAREVEELVAQVTIYIPKSHEKFESQIECFEKFNLDPSTLVMIKGLEVVESARGKKYAKILVQTAHSIAKEYGREHIITDIAFANIDSLFTFMNSGYIIVTLDHPVDDVELAIVYINLSWDFTDLDLVEDGDWIDVSAEDYFNAKAAISDGYFPIAMASKNDNVTYRCTQVPALKDLFVANSDEWNAIESQVA